jgi:hypothetical protein
VSNRIEEECLKAMAQDILINKYFDDTLPKYSFKQLNLQYIYLVSYKIAKKKNLIRKVCPYDIRKHNVFEIMPSFDQ